jgi:hypothetical protein
VAPNYPRRHTRDGFQRSGKAHILAVLVIALALVGCGKPREGLISELDDAKITEMDLYFRVIDLSPLFSGTVEMAADSIIVLASDAEIKRRALVWKMNAIPVAQSAIFRIDPLVALLDVWSFSVQMRDYYETGLGKSDFGEWQPIAARACRQIEKAVGEVGTALTGQAKLDKAEDFVRGWANENPIESPLFVRKSTRAYWASVIEEETGGGVVSSVQTMVDAIRVLSDRMEAYYETTAKQFRWQSEMLIHYELMRRQEVETVLEDFNRVAAMDRDVTNIARDIDTIEDEFTLLRRDFAAIVDSINAYWLTATTVVKEQGAMMDDRIRLQREAAVADLEAMSMRLIDESAAEMRRSIAGLVIPGVIGLVVLLAAPFALGFFTGRMAANRTHPPKSAAS